MNPLIEKIRKARQTRITVDGKTFIVRRPNDWEAYEISVSSNSRQMDLLERFVDGWEGITEADLVPGGDSSPVEFDRELFAEWISDQPKLWPELIEAITKEYAAHAEKLAEAEKK